jgi:hydroxymethylpyrimidine/phosphomethylpyrimidine kinase
VTAQNTKGVLAVAEVPEEVVALQIDAVLEDIGADAAKTGMLSGQSIIETVVDRLDAWGVEKLVVDPVMVAKSGDRLLQLDAVNALRRLLLPLALVTTPNIPEAEVLSGRSISNDDELKDAAKAIADLGTKFVVIKGGHREGAPIDLLFDGVYFLEFESSRIVTTNTHGTGCTYSAAITAQLARGLAVIDAVSEAKKFIDEALKASFSIGDGHSPVNHFFAISRSPMHAAALEG